MELGFYEKVQGKVENRMGKVFNKIDTKTKGKKPFGMVKMETAEQIFHIEQSGYLDDPFGYEQESGQSFAALQDLYNKLRSRIK